jgi:iron complex transport system substrate-binding protein
LLLLLLLLALLAACAPADAPARDAVLADSATVTTAPVAVTDDAGHELRLAHPARRIISLVPSATETLLALGAREQLVARTRYDTDPALAELPSLGGGLDPSLEALVALRPELVVVFETAGGSPLGRQLERVGVPVFGVAPEDTADAFAIIGQLGDLAGREAAADSLASTLRAELDAVRRSVAGLDTPSVFYVAGLDPLLTPGPHTFVSELIGVAGGRVLFPELTQHWPQGSLEQVVRRQPDVVLVPVGDAEVRLKAILGAPGWRDLRAVREGRVVPLDAELLSRPGPRLGEAARALRAAIHPTAAEPRP